ncbi:MAG: hypothetical protein ACHQKY_13020, partial [Terriglobia bacterium]
MQLGLQDRKKLIVLLVCMALLIVAGIYAYNSWPGGQSSAVATAPPPAPKTTARPQNAASYRQQRRKEAIDINTFDPTIHVEKLSHTSASNYTATKRNLFRYEVAPPPPPPKKTQEEIDKENRVK